MPDRLIALVLIVILLPFLAVLSLLLLVGEGWPIFFIQKRIGKYGKVFKIIKFRTMKVGAEKEQKKLLNLNEADGPVFKIHNDPRHTGIGRFLFHTGLDELPQLINILKGEMAVVGPRPLPVAEEDRIDEKYRSLRRQVKPGLVSPWIVNGYHRMKFNDWMKSDVEYVRGRGMVYDVCLLGKSAVMVVRLVLREIFQRGVSSKRTAELGSK